MADKETTHAQAARRITKLLASAEDAAKAGDEALRDAFLDKATALQLKYVVDMTLVGGDATAEMVLWQDFCQESNTPLIKAKRTLVANLAVLYRGSALMMGDWKISRDGLSKKWDQRAKVRVWAHTTDLELISGLYTSLLLQMQSQMARDERAVATKITNAWRVAYAHAWVRRVLVRLREVKERQEAGYDSTPGAALALRDRGEVATAAMHASLDGGKVHTRKVKIADGDARGRAAGDAAGRLADLGQQRVAPDRTPQLPA